MPNPNPAQPSHEPVLQHVDPPDLYELPEEHGPDEAPQPTTAGAADEPVDGFGNAIRGHEHDDSDVCDAIGDDEWYVCDDKAAAIREEQDAKQAERHLEHRADLDADPSGKVSDTEYPLGVDPAVAEAEHEAHADDPVSEPYEPGAYNKTDDAFVPSDEETRITEGFAVEHRHDGGDWHSHETDEAPHGEG